MNQLFALAWSAGVVAALLITAPSNAQAQALADSIAEFSGVQGQGDWYYGYRNYTTDGSAEDYDPATGFIPFAGGEGAGGWDGVGQMWTGTLWDLETAAAGPWTEIQSESVHPNGDNSTPNEEHWVVRRWIANELTGPAALTIRWNTRKTNPAGNGVTGGIWVNGRKLVAVTISGADTTGVTRTNYITANKGDRIDLVLTPVGTDGGRADANDGSAHWMKVDRPSDTDADGLPDPWELEMAGDLAKLTATGDFDGDSLTDTTELARGTNPTQTDTDADGLPDNVETNTGTFVSATDTGTDPLSADSDSDLRKDGDEVNVNPKTNPVNPDTDGDTYSDGLETLNGHNPADANDTLVSSLIANSVAEFSGEQGRDGWNYGYRNASTDGGSIESYDPVANFTGFAGGDGLGEWDGTTQLWTGTMWDLNTAAAAPWDELGTENVHPNGPSPVHWVIRRWSATELTKVTPLALRYHVHKLNTGGGNGVTAGIYINGHRADTVTIAGSDGVGVTRTYFANVASTDKIDLILSPRGTDGTDSDGADGSSYYLHVDPILPQPAFQPDGTVFIPANPADTDSDGIADLWEMVYFPGDLTRLTATGDLDSDGLTDPGEYTRDSDPTKPDTDADGLPDRVETKTATFVSATDTGSDPRKADSDGDGLSDGAEVNGSPATNPNKADSDGDSFSDAVELEESTNPNDPTDNSLSGVIANSIAEFSGVQGKDGWFNGYRNFATDGGGTNYNPTTQFIAYAGGEGQGPWDGASQLWTGDSWDLETAAAGPWTYQASQGIHPNGENSAPNEEHWAIRRWVADELTNDLPVTIIWQVRKENPAGGGVAGMLFINGILADSQTIAGTNSSNPKRRYSATLKKGDIVDLALTPENIDGTRGDGSDGSITWFWVDTHVSAPAGPRIISSSYVAAQGQFTLAWESETGATYAIQSSPDLKAPWTNLKTGHPSGGTTTSYTDPAGVGVPMRFYQVLKE